MKQNLFFVLIAIAILYLIYSFSKNNKLTSNLNNKKNKHTNSQAIDQTSKHINKHIDARTENKQAITNQTRPQPNKQTQKLKTNTTSTKQIDKQTKVKQTN